MNDPLLIVAALNGTRQRDACPKVPLSPEELAAEAKRAVEAGAGMVHVHARKSDGSSTFFSVLRDLPDLASVHVRPPEAELPAHREEARQIIQALDTADVRPAPVAGSLDALGDLEVLYNDSLLGRAPFVMLTLGAATSESSDLAAGTPQNVLRLIDAVRSVLAQPPIVASGRDAASPVVQAVAAAAGEHIRVGFEDAATLPDGSPATSNAQLVEHAVRLGAALGRAPMPPAEARRLLR